MTNDKDRELIERFAEEVYLNLPVESRFSLPEYLKEFAQHIIARYLAGRGKEAFCFVKVGSDGKYGGASPTPFGPCKTPVFLAPQPAIPEGMALVPIEPTDEMIEAGKWQIQALNGLESAYKAMIAAAGVKP